MIHNLIIFILVCISVIAGSMAWGFVTNLLMRKEPLRLATASHRRLRWLAAELQKELDKSGEERP